jgi:hypothetical protein
LALDEAVNEFETAHMKVLNIGGKGIYPKTREMIRELMKNNGKMDNLVARKLREEN